MPLLSKKLDKKWANEVMHAEVRLMLAVINDLYEKGVELGRDVEGGTYGTIEEFYAEHDRGESALCRLEGKSDRKDRIFILRDCPMSDLLASAAINGRMPEHYANIVRKWKETYKKKGAILSPFCIVHQVIRGTIGEQIKIGNRELNIVQVACRSMRTGYVAFADEGMQWSRFEEDDVRRMIEGKACMYAAF